MTRTRAYRDGVLEAEDFPAELLSDYLRDVNVTVWMDLCAPAEDDLAMAADELGLHALAIEDAVSEHQRAKLDHYDTHCFLTAYGVKLDEESGILAAAEIDAFVTERALVTVRKSERFDIDAVLARWDSATELGKSGVGYLLHGLLDYIVDGYFSAVQSLDDQIEALEDMVFDDTVDHKEMQRRSLYLRKSLTKLRRVVLPMREVVNSLMRRDLGVVDDVMGPYFQDVYDHVLRATEWTESLRDLVTTVRETQLTIQGNRLNVIMKKLTGWAAIIAVPTAITGFYGQNVPYPGFSQWSGFITSTVAILLIAGALYALFKRRDWL
ncbi:magnesium transporter CorA family protein [Amycolatopsis alkalitolerans]|uniref:Magnesium transporter CorA family protein n=1 Tax=Amycolatopsis alkalitolerans TaxID=2547244 RepID=A0A5C4LW14_9PSEU|nr:magnesium transporter CorA family protein [Amycolatopsis alkalitolerans]TNC23572.1 magnesium transporter CorA family protein [Amycolatopsis alkalitolerans]